MLTLPVSADSPSCDIANYEVTFLGARGMAVSEGFLQVPDARYVAAYDGEIVTSVRYGDEEGHFDVTSKPANYVYRLLQEKNKSVSATDLRGSPLALFVAPEAHKSVQRQLETRY